MFYIMLADASCVCESLSIADSGSEPVYTSGRNCIHVTYKSSETTPVTGLSVSGKDWKLPPFVQVDESMKEAAGGSELLAKLLMRRGVLTAEEARTFLYPSTYQPTSPSELPDMEKAVARISQAISGKEHITVYGDYDVDGVTGTSVLVSVLRLLGASVDFYIPNRIAEGYGLNLKAVSILASKRRTKLIISCDCGVSNFAEISFAKSLGVDTIVTDHHSMPEILPPAVAILHPKLLAEEHPLFHLPGVGVAYKLCEALLLSVDLEQEVPRLLDFVTLGMIADMVPLVRENRYLVQIGLPHLVNSARPGIKALLTQVNSNSSGTDIVGFGLAPRINAVGRLSDAALAVDLMTTEDAEVADKLARQLQLENTRRQELCERIVLEADQMVTSKIDLTVDKAIVIYKEGWHHGVVGIVASRLVEKYHCPVFVGELDPDESVIKGSARGVDGVDLYEVLKANAQLMTRWGGHKMAAGFSLEASKGDTFCRAITETCTRMLAEKDLQPVLEVDAVVEPQVVTMDLVETLSRLAPFGMSNKKPVLVMRALSCTGTRVLGKEGKHSRIMLEDRETGLPFECVYWNSRGRVPAEGLAIDVAFNPEINTYNGRSRIQLVVTDWRDPAAPQISVSQASSNAGVTRVTASAPASAVTKLPGDAPASAVTETPAGARVAAVTETPPAAPVFTVTEVPAAEARTSTGTESRAGAPVSDSTDSGNAGPVDGNDRAPAAVPERSAQRSDQIRPARSLPESVSLTWKDLRNHETPEALLQAAARKLHGELAVFAESCTKVDGIEFCDRTSFSKKQNLLIWQYPPTRQVFQSLLSASRARSIYLIGGSPFAQEDASGFIKRLLGLARFAVNQKDGKVEGEKLAAVLGASKMSVALGLTVLRKLSILDWFAEEGVIYLDILDQPSGKPEDLAEFRQLSDSLKEIFQFRSWCASSKLKDIQLEITPNQIELAQSQSSRRNYEPHEFQDSIGAEQGAVKLPANQPE